VWQQLYGGHIPVVCKVPHQLVLHERPYILTLLQLRVQAWQHLPALMLVQLVNFAPQALLL
jgi:hypothetical protein